MLAYFIMIFIHTGSRPSHGPVFDHFQMHEGLGKYKVYSYSDIFVSTAQADFVSLGKPAETEFNLSSGVGSIS